MDDLLALFDDGSVNHGEESNNIETSSDSDDQCQVANNSSTSGRGGTGRSHPSNDCSHHSSSKGNLSRRHHSTSNNSSHSTVDPLTKIRIVNRQVSKVDLVDIFAPFSFHTTAVLASMPNKNLASLIVPTTKSNNANSLSGRTHAATMGIIFKNSGTRISKNTGRAFTIVTVGDLNTGPTVSFMLFGQAYSKFTTRIKNGDVVAFVGMSLLPMKDNYGKETRISFSVNDVDQVVWVGKALDYGVCAGHVLSRNGNGYNSSYQNNYNQGGGGGGGGEKRRCQNYVDLRIAKFCQYHIKQQMQTTNSKVSSSSSSSKSVSTSSRNVTKHKLNAIQAMKLTRAETALKRQAVNSNRFASTTTSSSSSTSHNTTVQSEQSNSMTMVMPMHGSKSLARSVVTNVAGRSISDSVATNNSAVNKIHIEYSRRMMNVPKHMTKGQSLQAHQRKENVKGGRVQNPYNTSARNSAAMKCKSTSKPEETKQSMNNSGDILGSVLMTSSKKSELVKRRNNESSKSLVNKYQKKRKTVQAHTEGFDGQVFIPKPNKLFARKTMPSHMMTTSISPLNSTNEFAPVTPSPDNKAAMMDKQRSVAEKMRLSRLNAGKNHMSKITTQVLSSKAAVDKNDFLGFGSMDDSQREKLLSSKSKYDMEANAELFAKSRNVLTELEKKETSQDKKKSKNAKDHKDCMINKLWFCATCKRKTRARPAVCIRQNHAVKPIRELKQKQTTVEKRSGLSTKAVGDGGLVLGAGLEWSGWNSK